MIHRGPDDEGFYFGNEVAFGFRRLSIIDLGGGHQPMSDREESVWVVFNGEIYNFPELRKELEQLGHFFCTKSDTEVIIHGYKQWGTDVLEHLNGMFGLAIWDVKRKRLMLARDRMGIKLIYYTINDGSLYFGSEIRPLLSNFSTKPEIDYQGVYDFLRYRYTPSPLTVFKGIHKLAPGTRIIAEGGTMRVERWWNFRPEPFDPMPGDDEARDQLLELYQRAVRRQLISDVPLGLLLSGGLDSGLLLALMNQNGHSWQTFTVGYGKTFKDDELSEAARTASILKADNVRVELSTKDFEEALSSIISCLEEPVASSSIVPMYFVCQRARQDVKTAFVGQGPDELFGGYKRHLGVYYGAYWRLLPGNLRSLAKQALALLPRSETVKRALYSLDMPGQLLRYQQVFSIVPEALINGLFQNGLLAVDDCMATPKLWQNLHKLSKATDELGGLQFIEMRSSLPDELLMYADKLSMANSLELRVPYLDQAIVEYVECLSSSFKIRHGQRKWLHREVCRCFLPKEIIRRKKKGFAVNVVDRWLKNNETTQIENMLLDSQASIYGFLRKDVVKSLVMQHQSGLHDNHKILFSIAVLEKFLRIFMR